jgi:hypothetical protein
LIFIISFTARIGSVAELLPRDREVARAQLLPQFSNEDSLVSQYAGMDIEDVHVENILIFFFIFEKIKVC